MVPQTESKRASAGLPVEVRYSAAGTKLGHISSLGRGPSQHHRSEHAVSGGVSPGHDAESAAEPVTGVSRFRWLKGH